MSDKRYSTRQRLVVLTFDDSAAAVRFDEGLLALLTSARDLIDEWHELCDDQPGITLLPDLDALGECIEQLRRATFELRQATMRDE